MYASFKGAALAALISIAGVSVAHAQSAPRVYENGSVWSISKIETKPGMFDDYMAYLNGPWRTIQEAQKKAGDVLSYHVLAVASPRDGEPDVILMVELKNMAVFDRTQEEMDRQASTVFGGTVKANQAYASRQSMRTERGALLAREMKFK
jgi:hypothetical protein